MRFRFIRKLICFGALLFCPLPLFAAGGQSFQYDANGNLIAGNGQYYEYNDANKLVRVRHGDAAGPVIAEYVYDHAGQRIKKIEDGVTTWYVGKHFEKQDSHAGPRNTKYYFANTTRVAKKNQIGDITYYHTDHLGGTNVVSDGSGNLIERTKYYPFGDIRSGGLDQYSYTGKEKDNKTDFYYYEARYYGANFRHFWQPDWIGTDIYDPQTVNRYAYVKNNPIKFNDPTGNKFQDILAWNWIKKILSFIRISKSPKIVSPQHNTFESFPKNDQQEAVSNTKFVYDDTLGTKVGYGECVDFAKAVTTVDGEKPFQGSLGYSDCQDCKGPDMNTRLSEAVNNGNAFLKGNGTIKEGNIIVLDGYGRGTANHVAVVVDINKENGNLIIYEQNYEGRFVSKREISPDDKSIYGAYDTKLLEKK